MRILLDYRPALRQRTGVGEYAHELVRALAAEGARRGTGDRLAVLTASWKDRPAPAAMAELAGVEIIDRRIPVRPLTWSWNRLGWPPVEWLAGPVDVIHAQAPLLIPSALAAQLITIHDLDFLKRPDRARAEMRRDYPALVHAHAQRAHQVVVSSRYAAAEVARQLSVARDRISICSPGVPHWAAAVVAQRRAGGGGHAILFMGTLEARKNLGGLVEAYAQLVARRAHAPPLVLAGRVVDPHAEWLRRIRADPLRGRVRLLGYVAADARPALYRDARMLVLPSFEEGFGLPVLEAMACGVPVVVSGRGALPEVAGPAARPVEPDDVGAIAGEMERLLDAAEARSAAENGLVQAARYTWDGCARAAREAYRAAVAVRGQ